MTTINGTNLGKTMEDMTIPVSQRTSTRDLGQQDFLKIMIAQMRGQNPLDGGGDSNQFFQQMVQFQTLDAMTSMHKAITNLAQISDLANASSMIGKSVIATVAQPADPDSGMPRPDRQVSGKVVSVMFGDSGAMLNLEGNITVAASKVAVIQ
jgi:flagellar hook assembly protein FlgD